jgi:hypothetical protein
MSSGHVKNFKMSTHLPTLSFYIEENLILYTFPTMQEPCHNSFATLDKLDSSGDSLSLGLPAVVEAACFDDGSDEDDQPLIIRRQIHVQQPPPPPPKMPKAACARIAKLKAQLEMYKEAHDASE